jgi:hypothetical protein
MITTTQQLLDAYNGVIRASQLRPTVWWVMLGADERAALKALPVYLAQNPQALAGLLATAQSVERSPAHQQEESSPMANQPKGQPDPSSGQAGVTPNQGQPQQPGTTQQQPNATPQQTAQGQGQNQAQSRQATGGANDPQKQAMQAGLSAQASQAVGALNLPWTTVWSLVQKYGPKVLEEVLALLQRHSPQTVQDILNSLGMAGRP